MNKKTKLNELQKSAQTIYDQAILEDRDLSNEERDHLKKLYDEGKEIVTEIAQQEADEELKQSILGLEIKSSELKTKG